MKQKREVNELIIDPKVITKRSPIGGCSQTRHEEARRLNLRFRGEELSGDWDLTNHPFDIDRLHWRKIDDQLYRDIEKRGYCQDPDQRYIEVGIARTGEIFLVDGRHRLACAQLLKIPHIPVDVIYIHPEYDFGNLRVIHNNTIPSIIYNRIALRWGGNASVYQSYGSIKDRFTFTSPYLGAFRGKKVLDIGCNAGMMVWSVMQYAESYTGLEKNSEFFLQCQETIQCLKGRWDKPAKCIHTRLQDYLPDQDDFNALMASYILYHLSKPELDILKRFILPRCDVVIVPSRAKERKSNINKHFLNRERNVRKFFDRGGFKTQIYRNPEDGYFILIGERA